MKNELLFEKIHCVGRDDKARRRLNVAPSKPARITAERLEKGVTLEALEDIGAPVFRYATQITIHGLLPDYSPPPFGYRFLTKNKNGSIGVKFGGIDAAKKERLYRAARAGSLLNASLTSQGLTLGKTFYMNGDAEKTKAEAIAFARDMQGRFAPLIYGEIYGQALPWGAGFAVYVFVGAVPVENVGALSVLLCGFETEAEVEAETERKERARREETRAYLESRAAELKAAKEADCLAAT
jgi:hypothetical protein